MAQHCIGVCLRYLHAGVAVAEWKGGGNNKNKKRKAKAKLAFYALNKWSVGSFIPLTRQVIVDAEVSHFHPWVEIISTIAVNPALPNHKAPRISKAA